MADHPPIGIDLGTTHSLVAVLDEDGPRVLADEHGHTLIPSAVALDDDGRALVGVAARERLVSRPDSAVTRFKASMGTATAYPLGPHGFSAVSLSAMVLREVRAVAERHLGREIREVVVSVPAWFREPQRRATVDAASLAGLSVRRLVNEPTAAALAHALHASTQMKTVAVLDLGGGTFDVTLLELFEGLVDVRASVGAVDLGGEDFTDALVQHLLTLAPVAPSRDPARLARLRLRAEVAKRALTTADAAQVDLSDLGGAEATVTRATFDHLVAPLCDRVRRGVREALMQSGLRPADIDEVLLVGGATRMPAVARLARDLFDREPVPGIDVDRVVALGAAVQAGLVAKHAAVRERLVNDVLTHSLGVAVLRRHGDQAFPDRFDPILARGTTLPATRAGRYSTVHPKQPGVRIQVYEGEHRDATRNELLGTVVLDGIPEAADPNGNQDLEIRFTHDASGLLEVEGRVVSTGASARTVVERAGRGYSPTERAEAEALLARLRTHPRDLLPNRWLVERATRVVEMSTGDVRRALDHLLDTFEAALEEGDPERIDQVRALLRRRVEALGRDHDLDLP